MARFELSLIAGLALLALVPAVLWFAGEKQAWGVFQLERLIRQDQPIDPELMRTTVARAAELNQALLPGAHLHSHALLATRLATQEDIEPAERLELRQNALVSLERALTREPADTFAWARLAHLRHGFAGPSAEVVAALRLSIYTAPTKPSLLNWRLSLATANRDFWDENFTQLVHAQILHSWRVRPHALVAAVVEADLVPLAREVLLAQDSNNLPTFDNLLDRHQR